jgi:hypothetical protein
VEQKVVQRWRRWCVVWLALVLLTSETAHAHGIQYLLAKAQVTPEGNVRVEISADYRGNPLIENEAKAREAILGILNLQHRGQTRLVGEKTGFTFHADRVMDPTCPAQFPLPPGAGQHELLTAITEEPIGEGEVTFGIPAGNPLDVVFWQVDAQGQALPDQKYFLIAGDTTKPLQIPPAAKGRPAWPWLLSFMALLGLYGWSWRKRQKLAAAFS